MIDVESPMPPSGDRGVPVTPQLAMRVAMLGVLAFALFAIVFFRLWFLQVLSGDQYRAQANDNRIRNLAIQAPRGKIVDADSKTIVDSVPATVVQISPNRLPAAERLAAQNYIVAVNRRAKLPKGHRGPSIQYPKPATPALAAEFVRLSKVIQVSPQTIQQRVVNSLVQLPYASIDIKVNIPASQRSYLLENQREFPSIDPPATEYLRHYPRHELAAQLLGTVGQINAKEIKLKKFKGVRQGTTVGQNGLEWTYDHILRGVNGIQRYTVDASGNPKGGPRVARPPASGDSLQLTVSLGLEQAGQDALQSGVNDALANGNSPIGAAFVAMDPRNGAILGMGSWPSFDPGTLQNISQAHYNRLVNSASSNHPLVNRAAVGEYPTGSAFKPITAMAALVSGQTTPDKLIDDTGCITVSLSTFCDAGSTKDDPKGIGAVNLVNALTVSSDVYFYRLGESMFHLKGQVLQTWARRLGLGASTQGDIPDIAGTIPDTAWRDGRNALQEKCLKSYSHVKQHKPCEIVDGIRPYSVGDNIQLATGQGDLQASPLQMAVVYAALANGGSIVRPHVGKAILSPDGSELEPITEPPVRRVKLNQSYVSDIMQGLYGAASTPQGTSGAVFSDYDHTKYPVFGKTGTAERQYADGIHNQSWYVAYSYDGSPQHKPIVLAVTIERGGFGAEAAAPAACQILDHWFHINGKCTPGTSQTR